MKKRLAVLLILLLCLPVLAQAYTGSYGGSTLFTFSYDSGRFRMDQDSYLGGNRSNQVWFFMLYDSDYTIDCGMFVNESTQSMSNGDTSALSLYLAGYYALWCVQPGYLHDQWSGLCAVFAVRRKHGRQLSGRHGDQWLRRHV